MIIEIKDIEENDFRDLLEQYIESFSDDIEDKLDNKEKLQLAQELLNKYFK